ncbi:MAG: UDP-N-acetylglucosamine pyrophosphorylase, partial [Candidatus Omnitrophica bacterium]|nr:UDP-N-acetylglucosamine pyrophosphorylase [Candidatus Omnitrophota bacterium]
LKEINTGIIAFNCDALKRALRQVKQNIRKKEFYLTDVISIMHASGNLIGGVRVENADEAIGINSRVELASANKIMQTRINEAFMRQGVSIVDPASTFIDYGVKIGNDTVIYPFTVIENNVTIGSRCSVGPFLHVRAETRIADNVVVGNFLEIARTSLSSGTFVKHFGYLGDSRVGRQVNIGAGVVTANFDGKAKHITTIKDHAFVGSDTVCVAPVEIGAYAVTGAGSVVTRRSKVPRGSVVAGVPARPLVSKKTK